ncbi:hypothetical protein M408DRAFT_218118 [Serendipita vermifera MAFF 305830]|uniref:Transcription initiation factor TFIID subunit 12 domain-containing protein n=1 Tax=Serendipita vermifera MAFF 305830 TaxID=933852 RepID=A0A0C3B6D0_SERVB|nr:hypothetical protein M408DRAFT_218118 [Serendipita vermifera MAFF 305830]
MASDFLTSMANFSCRLASHRGSENLDTRDVELYLGEQLYYHDNILLMKASFNFRKDAWDARLAYGRLAAPAPTTTTTTTRRPYTSRISSPNTRTKARDDASFSPNTTSPAHECHSPGRR